MRGRIVKLFLCAALITYHSSLITHHLSLITSTFLLLTSCTQDAYEKGEGEYSLLVGDFGEAHSNASKQIDYIITDDGTQLPLSPIYQASWVTKADSLYRIRLYYNKVSGARGEKAAEVLSMGKVPTPIIRQASQLQDPMKTDPVHLESSWKSKTGRFLNLRLRLMTGTDNENDTISQQLGIVCDTLMLHADGKQTCHLTLYHSQNGQPEYYSTTVFMSIPLWELDVDTIQLRVNTYQGEVRKQYILK